MFVHDLPVLAVFSQDRCAAAFALSGYSRADAGPAKLVDAACGAIAPGDPDEVFQPIRLILDLSPGVF
jgi:hypothetical protein